MLRESLDSLTAIEKSIITERYMKDRSQDEVAKSLGLSQVKVSRIEKKSKEKMKKFVSS
jgi:RNA polymerase sporulation-specific sigma factor